MIAHDDLSDFNSLAEPERIKPSTTEWHAESETARPVPPHSFTLMGIPVDLSSAGK
jgi:hypothetical protein